MGLPGSEDSLTIRLSRFDTIPACDIRTDGRTDRRTEVQPIAITCVSLLMHVKKQLKEKPPTMLESVKAVRWVEPVVYGVGNVTEVTRLSLSAVSWSKFLPSSNLPPPFTVPSSPSFTPTPCPSPLHCPLLLPFSMFTFLLSFPFPQIQLRAYRQHCEVPGGLGQSPSRNWIWCMLSEKSGIWWE